MKCSSKRARFVPGLGLIGVLDPIKINAKIFLLLSEDKLDNWQLLFYVICQSYLLLLAPVQAQKRIFACWEFFHTFVVISWLSSKLTFSKRYFLGHYTCYKCQTITGLGQMICSLQDYLYCPVSKFYRRYYNLISKFQFGLKSFLR